MMLRSAHHAGVTPWVSQTWRNSTNNVLASSTGTIQRLIIGPLNGCSSCPFSQIGATCCKLGRAQIGKDDSALLIGRVGAVMEPVLERAVRRLARGLEDRPVCGEQPPVVAAAYPPALDQPELERGPAMRAVQLQQARIAALVA